MGSNIKNMDNKEMNDQNKESASVVKESSKTETSKKRKKTAKKSAKEVKVDAEISAEVKNNQESNVGSASVKSTQNNDETEKSVGAEALSELIEVDSIELERIKSQFINLTGYPIRIQCNGKWAQIPADKEVARVLYAVAFKDKIGGMDVYSHGVNAITGLPDPKEGKYYLVLPEVRFLLPKRNDLVTHGELMYDDQTKRPIGFKNLFCSFDGAENIINFNNKNTD